MKENNVIVSDFVNREEIKRRVNQLLQEIEKIEDELKKELEEAKGWLTLENRYIEEIDLVRKIKRKIKKTFRGLIE